MVGPMILVVALRDARLRKGVSILPVKGDGGGVVMNTCRVDLKLFDDVQGQTKEETAGRHRNQEIQSTSHTIVVDRTLFFGRQTEG
jgi:hypothetical protein